MNGATLKARFCLSQHRDNEPRVIHKAKESDRIPRATMSLTVLPLESIAVA